MTKDEFYAFLFPRNYDRTKYLYVKEMMEHLDDNEDGVITFDEFVLVKGIDIADESETNQLQLQVERRSFDNKDMNLNGALEGSELDAYLNPPGVKWYESECMYLIGKMDRNNDLLLSKVLYTAENLITYNYRRKKWLTITLTSSTRTSWRTGTFIMTNYNTVSGSKTAPTKQIKFWLEGQ